MRDQERLKNDEIRKIKRWKARQEAIRRHEQEEKEKELNIALHGGVHQKSMAKKLGHDEDHEKTAIDLINPIL